MKEERAIVMRWCGCFITLVLFSCSNESQFKSEEPKESPAEKSKSDDNDKVNKVENSEELKLAATNDQAEKASQEKSTFKKNSGATMSSFDGQNIPKLSVNHSPRFTSDPIRSAIVEKEYSHQIQAIDEEKDQLEFSLVEGPFDMSINEKGLVKWTPSSGLVGSQSITIKVQESANSNHYALQAFSLEVVASSSSQPAQSTQQAQQTTNNVEKNNWAPQIVSKPSLKVFSTTTYSYQILASDPEKNAMEYSLTENPGDMSINDKGLITWKPTISDVGVHNVSVKVQEIEKHDNFAIQSFTPLVLPPLKMEKKIVFPTTIKECGWNVDGNLSQGDQSIRSRREQVIDVSELPQNAIIIDMSFSFQKQPVLYNDAIILTFNDFILMMSHKNLLTNFEKQSDFALFQWTKLAGKFFDSRSGPAYCIGKDAGLGRCVVPPSMSEGLFELEMADSVIAEISRLAREKGNKYQFTFVTTGDNADSDCQHKEISFDVVIYYVLPNPQN